MPAPTQIVHWLLTRSLHVQCSNDSNPECLGCRPYLCLRLDLCRLREQHSLCDSAELIQDVDEGRLQEGPCLIIVL